MANTFRFERLKPSILAGKNQIALVNTCFFFLVTSNAPAADHC
jgi:hypothetical protein